MSFLRPEHQREMQFDSLKCPLSGARIQFICNIQPAGTPLSRFGFLLEDTLTSNFF